MKIRLHDVLAVCLVLLQVGCAPWIKGFANSALYKPLPSAGTFKVEYLGGNAIEATKLNRILVYQFKKLGYKNILGLKYTNEVEIQLSKKYTQIIFNDIITPVKDTSGAKNIDFVNILLFYSNNIQIYINISNCILF